MSAKRKTSKRRTSKKRTRKTRSTRSAPRSEYPGWLWMLFGLAIGLSVAMAILLRDERAAAPPEPVAATPVQPAYDDNNESTAAAPEPEPRPERRFDFYHMLPNFEVVIPEEEPDVEQDNEPRAVEQPGTYVLQAGSFIEYADADRRRAELALQGIESRIQRVAIDDKTYHRVRIGPTRDLDELNMLRSRLRAAQIDVLRIRLGD